MVQNDTNRNPCTITEDKRQLNVLYQFNEKYVPFAGTSIVSLLENNKGIDYICIYIIGENISENSQQKLQKQISMYDRKVVFIDSESVIEKMKTLGINSYRGSYAANMKLFISEFLSDDIDRILYIDSDTVVTGELTELVDIDLGQYPVGMVLDSMCGWHKKAIGFVKQDEYYNSGVMLFDVKKWKDKKCTERLCDHMINICNKYMCPDQDIVNLVLKGEIYRIDLRYNLQPLHIVYKYSHYKMFFNQLNYYSRQEIRYARNNAVIHHFFRYLGEFPWDKDSQHPDKKLFDKYIETSEWKDYKRTEPDHTEWVFRVERVLHKFLPRRIFIIIFKVSYEFYMWKTNMDYKRKR